MCWASQRPNGSRLSCGRPARRRKGVGRSPCPARGNNTPIPLERSAPGSFKRLLGRCRSELQIDAALTLVDPKAGRFLEGHVLRHLPPRMRRIVNGAFDCECGHPNGGATLWAPILRLVRLDPPEVLGSRDAWPVSAVVNGGQALNPLASRGPIGTAELAEAVESIVRLPGPEEASVAAVWTGRWRAPLEEDRRVLSLPVGLGEGRGWCHG